MLASLSWLGKFVDINGLSPAYVAERLSMLGLEVESVTNFRSYLDKVVAARLVESEPLGNLTRCLLDISHGNHVQVLCGAKNLSLNSIYPLAPLGTVLPSGIIKKMTVQGVDSDGMLASAFELLLGDDTSGLMELPKSTEPGTRLSLMYPEEDWILEIGVTPNRGDALSHLGIARDLAAILDKPLMEPDYSVSEEGERADTIAKVSIMCPDGCLRYCGRIIRGARPSKSPLWLASRLISLGIRSINNVVDVTNFVMLELGLPLHAFDLDFLKGREIIVRSYGQGTRFTTLDGEERILKEEDNVLICDKEKPVAIGGIMGGLNSEVTQDTLDVFLEAAMFNPVNIRRTSKSLNLSTDASYRFERGQDVLRCPQAVSRAAALISSLTYGKVAPGILDCYPKPYHHRCISFSPTRCNELLGTNYEASEMRRALFALGFNLSNDENDPDSFQALVPSFRPDVFGEADLFEEVVRTLDFENLPATIPKPPKPANLPPDSYRLRERLRNFMAGQGFLELMSYSFINPQTLDKLGLEETDPLKSLSVKILNPLSEEMGILRTSLIPSLLNSCRLNQYHNQWDLRLFELGAVFLSLGDESSPKEKQSFGALMASGMDSALWCDEKRALDFYDLKGVIEALSETFLETWDFSFQRELIPAFFDTRESAAIFRNNIFIGYMGLLKDSARRNYGLKDNGGPIYLFEIFPEGLSSETVSGFVPYSLYPGITRDLAFLVDSQVSAQELMEAIRESGDFPLKSLFVFDLYSGEKLPKGKKSLAFRLFFQDLTRTLNEELVSGYSRSIQENLEKKFQARLRD